MPSALLPTSAVAFGRRPSAIVRATRFRPWLTTALKQTGKGIRAVNVSKQVEHLKSIISDENAIWTLCWLSLPKSPEADLWIGVDSALAIHYWHMINIEAYIIYVDLELDMVVFKLTPETIKALVDYHKEVFLIDTAKNTEDRPGKEAQLIKLGKEFVRAASQYVYRTKTSVLEGLDVGGTGELLVYDSRRVKRSITNLFVPLRPPPKELRYLIPRLADSDAVNTAWCPSSMVPDVIDAWC